jgi:cytochrome c556
MKNWISIAILVSALAGIGLADDHEGPEYKKVASAHDIMEMVVKPAMGKIGAMKKAGGPATEKEWKTANAAASVIAEANQLMLMGGRVKDDAWKNGANEVIAAAAKTMQGAYRKDMQSYSAGVEAMSAGCKTCHTVHKKDKNAKPKN